MRIMLKLLAESQAEVKRLQLAQQVRGYMCVFEFRLELSQGLPAPAPALGGKVIMEGDHFVGHIESCTGHSGLI